MVAQPYRGVEGEWIHVVFDGLLSVHLTITKWIKEERYRRVIRWSRLNSDWVVGARRTGMGLCGGLSR